MSGAIPLFLVSSVNVGRDCVGGKVTDFEIKKLKLIKIDAFNFNLFLNESCFDLLLSFQILGPAPLHL
jgi:hypothetical protein